MKLALILFVEQHAAFRQSASVIMDREPDLEVVAQAGSVAQAREKMAEGGVDAAIVDIPLPDEGASEMVRELHEANPSILVLVLTKVGEDQEICEEFLKAGASEGSTRTSPLRRCWRRYEDLGTKARLVPGTKGPALSTPECWYKARVGGN